MELSKHRPNVRTIRNLADNGGLTLRNGYSVTYKTGYQVAGTGSMTRSPEEAMKLARHTYGGNCGIWFYEGWYYVDPCRRISTKWEALAVGRAENQISILRWKDMEIIYC